MIRPPAKRSGIRCIHHGLLMSLLAFSASFTLAVEVQVQGLFKGAAVLLIDGKQRMLKAGKRSPEGVLLLSADNKLAVVDIDGKRHELTLSRRITSNYKQVEVKEVAISRTRDAYITNATINGKRFRVIVDTGATSVAMSARDARRLGIDYESGNPGQVATASGVARSFAITLRDVSVGAIKVSSVAATVVDGDFPRDILLGMTFLKHVDMQERNGILYLKSKF